MICFYELFTPVTAEPSYVTHAQCGICECKERNFSCSYTAFLPCRYNMMWTCNIQGAKSISALIPSASCFSLTVTRVAATIRNNKRHNMDEEKIRASNEGSPQSRKWKVWEIRSIKKVQCLHRPGKLVCKRENAEKTEETNLFWWKKKRINIMQSVKHWIWKNAFSEPVNNTKKVRAMYWQNISYIDTWDYRGNIVKTDYKLWREIKMKTFYVIKQLERGSDISMFDISSYL